MDVDNLSQERGCQVGISCKTSVIKRHAVAIHFMWYNFVKIHQTLRMTPAMAAGVADRLWEPEDIIALLPN